MSPKVPYPNPSMLMQDAVCVLLKALVDNYLLKHSNIHVNL